MTQDTTMANARVALILMTIIDLIVTILYLANGQAGTAFSSLLVIVAVWFWR